MKKSIIWYIFLGSLFLLVLVLIFNSDFWNQVFITPSFSFETAIAILIFAFLAIIIIGFLFWNNYQTNLQRKGQKDKRLLKKIELGISIGAITSEGLTIQGKSKSCPFTDYLLLSMLEYSAILYQHGEIGNIYGPFPLTGMKTDSLTNEFPYERIKFISFGFKVSANTIDEGLAILIVYYPDRFDELVSTIKKRLNTLFKSVVNENLTLSCFNQETINKIENEIQIITLF